MFNSIRGGLGGLSEADETCGDIQSDASPKDFPDGELGYHRVLMV
jgi:hypothetical protein